MSGDNQARIIWSLAALRDIVRLRNFIEPHNLDASRRLAEALKKAASILMEHPAIGKIVEGRQEREIFVPFGQRGYAMRYRVQDDKVVILRIWHGLEDR